MESKDPQEDKQSIYCHQFNEYLMSALIVLLALKLCTIPKFNTILS